MCVFFYALRVFGDLFGNRIYRALRRIYAHRIEEEGTTHFINLCGHIWDGFFECKQIDYMDGCASMIFLYDHFGFKLRVYGAVGEIGFTAYSFSYGEEGNVYFMRMFIVFTNYSNLKSRRPSLCYIKRVTIYMLPRSRIPRNANHLFNV